LSRRRLAAPALILLAILVAAPVVGLDPGRTIGQYLHRHWQDELPQNTVHAISQDRDGYIWLGTYEGLVRFDGVRFVVFDANRTHDLAGNGVFDIFEDRSGAFWISTNGGLTRYDGGFETIADADALPDSLVFQTVEAPDGTMWIGTQTSLCRIVDGTLEILDWPGIAEIGSISALAVCS